MLDRATGDRATQYAVITAAMAGVIIYGSLFPFAFHARPDRESALRALLSTWHSWAGRGDSIANILLYVPFGFFAVQALHRPLSRARGSLVKLALVTVGLVTLAGLALSTSIELAQFYDAGRDSSMSDMYTNTMGTFLGAAAGAMFLHGLRLPLIGRMERRPFAALLLACWLGSQLYPYVPVIDLQKYKTAVAPLIHSPALLLLDLYRYSVTWLAVAVLLEVLFGAIRGRMALRVLVPAVLGARVLIADAVLSPAEVLGGGIAVTLWMVWLWKFRARAIAIAGLFTSLVVLEALAPFHFSAVARPFGWIPFLGFMQAPADTGIRVFLEKTFTYGSLIWLMVRCACGWSAATLFGFLLVLCLRFGQVYLPGRSAESTDAIMLLMLAVAMRWMEDDPGAVYELPRPA
jgi:VanZ family protein